MRSSRSGLNGISPASVGYVTCMVPSAFVITGVPALLIILVLLVIFVLGCVRLAQLIGRGVRGQSRGHR
jgi:hypothetical protein